MGKKITDHSELPEWFRESNYLAADNFSDFDWYVNAKIRRYVSTLDWNIYEANQYLKSELAVGEDPQETEEWISGLNHERTLQLQVIRSHVNGPIPIDTHLNKLGPAFQGYNIVTADNLLNPVSRMTVADLYSTLQELPENVRRKLVAHLASGRYLETLASESAEIASWMDLSLVEIGGRSLEARAAYRLGFGTLRVDLSIPDDLLEQSFKRFLKNARSEEQAWALDVDQKLKLNYQNWVDYGVLPYIDLTTWARENNRTVTSAYAAKALDEFGAIRDPEYRYTAYTIDTTVKKYSSTVLSSQVSSRLLEAASKEIKRRVEAQAAKS